jgi:hypothetical protein
MADIKHDMSNLNDSIYDPLKNRLNHLGSPKTPDEISKLTGNLLKAYYLSEYEKCKKSFLYFITYYATVPVTGTYDYVNLRLLEPQLKFPDNMEKIQYSEYIGLTYLASRQCGKTATLSAYTLWCLIFNDNYSASMMCTTGPLGPSTLSEVKNMAQRLPLFLRPKEVAPTNITQVVTYSNGSFFSIVSSGGISKSATAESTKGRGIRSMLVWIDEAAFINLEAHISAMLPTVSKTFIEAKKRKIPHGIILTSTPNGRSGLGKGFFDYYNIGMSNPEENKFNSIMVHWSEMVGMYDVEWYKNTTATLSDRKRSQEYDCVFLGGETSFISDEAIARLTDPTKFIKPIKKETINNIGYIHWFTMPDVERRYVVGVDTATKNGKDYSAIQVIDFDTEEQICEGRFKCEVNTFTYKYAPKILDLLRKKVIIVETNGPGNQTMENLSQKYAYCMFKQIKTMDKNEFDNYEKLGIAINKGERELLIDEIYLILSEYDHYIKSEICRWESTTLENKKGKVVGVPNDDLIIALGYCYYIKKYYPNIRFYFTNAEEEVEGYQETDDMYAAMFTDEEDIPTLLNGGHSNFYLEQEAIRYLNQKHGSKDQSYGYNVAAETELLDLM